MLFSLTNAGWLADWHSSNNTATELMHFLQLNYNNHKKTDRMVEKTWKKRSPGRERMLRYSNEMEHTCKNKFSCHIQNKNILSTMSLWLSHTHNIYTFRRLFVTTIFILSVESFGFQHQIISNLMNKNLNLNAWSMVLSMISTQSSK